MSLDELRSKIDAIDEKILGLFEERMNVVCEIAAFKQANNLPTLDRGREADKLRSLSGKISPQMEPLAHTLFDTLLELSRSHQSTIRESTSALYQEISRAIENTDRLFPASATVACQGVEGAFSQIACERIFKRPDIQYFKTFDSVFSAIKNGFC